jgi:peptide-methionine (S)-S-oxide reductase
MSEQDRINEAGLATFGAGCFWGVEARFRELPGVLDATAGYMGGQTPQPGYQAVCSGKTGHAEVVQVRYAPDLVDYETLLDLFFAMHNPTTRNRQGPDIGSQYRSVIFFHSESQQQFAAGVIEKLDDSGRWPQPVVTQLIAAPEFWPAEEYHQRYLEKNGRGLCSI